MCFESCVLGRCFDCGLGRYSSSHAATECAACAPGSFSSLPGQATCELCAVGGFCPTSGAASASVFVQCPTGTYNPTRGASSNASCLACPAGKASPVPGSIDVSACSPCLPGSYAPIGGLAACLRTPAGTYQDESGATAHKICRIGEYCPVRDPPRTTHGSLPFTDLLRPHAAMPS